MYLKLCWLSAIAAVACMGLQAAADTYNIPFNPVGGCTTEISDTFDVNDAAPLSTDWDEANDSHANCPWSISSSALRWDSDSESDCDNTVPTAIYKTALSGPNGWVCAEIENAGGANNWWGIILRAGSSTETTSWYRIGTTGSNTTAKFFVTENLSEFAQCTHGTSFGADDELCVHIKGTGESTTVDVWINPGAGTPDDFGTPDCTLSPSGVSDNVGNYVGVGQQVGDATISAYATRADFRAGTCP